MKFTHVLLSLPLLLATPFAAAQQAPAMPAPAAAPAAVPAAVPAKAAEAKPPPKPTFVGPYRVLNWDELVPPGWDPMKDFRDLNMAGLQDGDPRAMQMLKRMREVWDAAPSNPSLDGQQVRIPGFVVPLEEGKEGLTEFLLVPYFGACIHSPPPPANQIVHVLPRTAAKGLRSMDAVWISGTMKRQRNDSYMGASSYRLEARLVEPYSEKAPSAAAPAR
jgi:hypothetical protein